MQGTLQSVDPKLLLCFKMADKLLVPCHRGIYVELSEVSDASGKDQFIEGPETGGTERERKRRREGFERKGLQIAHF